MDDVMKNPLASEKIGKLVTRFTVPAIISMVVSSLYNIVDQIFIGQGVGLLGNEATNIAFPITTIGAAFFLTLGIGGASNYNLRAGEGHSEDAKYFAGNAMAALVLVGVILLVIIELFLDPLLHLFGSTQEAMELSRQYAGITAIGLPFWSLQIGGNHMVRADRSPKYSMLCMLVGAIINIILDPIFIFKCDWGIRGAAWATVIGQMAACVMVVVYFAGFSRMKLQKKHFMISAKNIKKIVGLGMASGINQIALALVQIVMNNVLRKYGAQSVYGADIPLAVVGIVMKVNMVFFAIAIGLTQGCQPIFGFNYGAKLYSRVRETYRTAAKAAIIVGIIFFACFQIFPRVIISWFGGGSEEYYHFAELYFRIFMLLTFINGIQPMSSGFFSSIGKAKLGMIVSLTRQVIFLIPLAIIFPIFFGIEGIVFSGPISDAAAAILTIFFVVRECRIMKEAERASASL